MNFPTQSVTLKEIFQVFLKMGLLGFGGPAAHTALMRKEVVEKRKWVSEQEFLDLMGATQLIPGPNSTELAIHLGYKMKGLRGLIVAGICFILPAFFCVLALSVFYQQYGNLPSFGSILAGIRPVIVAIIIDALFNFQKTAVKDFVTLIIAALALLLSYYGLSQVFIILVLGMGASFVGSGSLKSFFALPVGVAPLMLPVTSSNLFLIFLKIGSVLFGSGYVLLALIQSELVEVRTWLTQTQLLDAVTAGQITPGPVFTTATFIGYILKGYEGAVLATLGIFLPSFFFVFITVGFLKYLETSTFLRKFLDGVNAASFSLLLLVSYQLGRDSLISIPTLLIGFSSFFIMLKFKNLNSAWPILSGGILGFFFL